MYPPAGTIVEEVIFNGVPAMITVSIAGATAALCKIVPIEGLHTHIADGFTFTCTPLE